MKILITGHLGFVGHNLTDALGSIGMNWSGFDLKSNQDIRNKLQLEETFRSGNFDTVVCLSALTGVPLGNEYAEEYINTNIVGVRNLLELSKKYEIDNFIFYSSSSVYGGNVSKSGLKETDPTKPLSVYGITKVAGESLVLNSGLNYSIIRPFCIFGEKYGKEFSVIYKWIEQIKNGQPITFLGDGTSARGYTNVLDIVEATSRCVELMREGSLKNEVINLGGAEIVSLNDLAGMVKQFCKENKIKINWKKLKRPDYDIKTSFADILKAKTLLGYNPEKRFKPVVREILQRKLLHRGLYSSIDT